MEWIFFWGHIIAKKNAECSRYFQNILTLSYILKEALWFHSYLDATKEDNKLKVSDNTISFCFTIIKNNLFLTRENIALQLENYWKSGIPSKDGIKNKFKSASFPPSKNN